MTPILVQAVLVEGMWRNQVEKQAVYSLQKTVFETKGEKRKFIRESFQLDTSTILNVNAKLKEAVIKLFLDYFKVLATHPSQYGKTKVFEMKIDLVPEAIPYKSRVRQLNPDQKENLRDQIDK